MPTLVVFIVILVIYLLLASCFGIRISVTVRLGVTEDELAREHALRNQQYPGVEYERFGVRAWCRRLY